MFWTWLILAYIAGLLSMFAVVWFGWSSALKWADRIDTEAEKELRHET